MDPASGRGLGWTGCGGPSPPCFSRSPLSPPPAPDRAVFCRRHCLPPSLGGSCTAAQVLALASGGRWVPGRRGPALVLSAPGSCFETQDHQRPRVSAWALGPRSSPGLALKQPPLFQDCCKETPPKPTPAFPSLGTRPARSPREGHNPCPGRVCAGENKDFHGLNYACASVLETRPERSCPALGKFLALFSSLKGHTLDPLPKTKPLSHIPGRNEQPGTNQGSQRWVGTAGTFHGRSAEARVPAAPGRAVLREDPAAGSGPGGTAKCQSCGNCQLLPLRAKRLPPGVCNSPSAGWEPRRRAVCFTKTRFIAALLGGRAPGTCLGQKGAWPSPVCAQTTPGGTPGSWGTGSNPCPWHQDAQVGPLL